jgi:hypothetical protein
VGDNNKYQEIHGIIRDHFQNLYSNKLENQEEMGLFLTYMTNQKLDQVAINHLKRSITHNEIETAIKISQKRKVQDLSIITEFYETLVL